MKVRNYKVYRIIRYECLLSEVICLYGLSPIKRETFSSEIRGLYEQIFEDFRKRHTPTLPSRLECVFVFPDKDNFEEWTPCEGGQCYLLELELTGELVWFDAKIINENLANYYARGADNANTKEDINDIRKIAELYWSSASDKVLESKQCEGLFIGRAIITSIEKIMARPKRHKMETLIKIQKDYKCEPISDDELLYD